MLNFSIIQGRAVKDAALKKTATDKSVCTFTLAVKRDVGDATDFVDVVAWGQLAEFCAAQIRKGKVATAAGTLQSHSYEDKDGKQRKAWEIVAQRCYITEWENREGDIDDGELPF